MLPVYEGKASDRLSTLILFSEALFSWGSLGLEGTPCIRAVMPDCLRMSDFRKGSRASTSPLLHVSFQRVTLPHLSALRIERQAQKQYVYLYKKIFHALCFMIHKSE